MPRDARRIPYPPPGSVRIEARHTTIRIRIDGRWLPGHIQRWSRLPDGTLAVWLSYKADPEHPTVSPVWAWVAWDPEAIEPA